MKQKPTVSICMITYNHQDFIEEAMLSVLNQKCNFEIELIVSNDCSTDQTHQIVTKIIQTHTNSNVIRYINHEKNLGMMPNFVQTLQKCSGKYIAICDGDDYWIDDFKLQQQYDFLEEHQEFALHAARAATVDSKKQNDSLIGCSTPKIFELFDFYSQNKLLTCTVFFRNTNLNFPKNYAKLTFGDWFLYVYILKKTGLKVFHSDAVFARYRIHKNSVMSSQSTINNYKAQIFQINFIHKYLKKISYSLQDIKIINQNYLTIFRYYLNQNKYLFLVLIILQNLIKTKFRAPIKKYLSAIKHHNFHQN